MLTAVAFLVQCLQGPDCTSDWCSNVLRQKETEEVANRSNTSNRSNSVQFHPVSDCGTVGLSVSLECFALQGTSKGWLTLQHDSDAQFHTAHGKDRECENRKDAWVYDDV